MYRKMGPPKPDTITFMNILLKLRICNGFGDTVRNSLKQNLVPQLMEETHQAITPVRKDWPYFTEEMPNDGWTGFDLHITCPIRINVTQIIKQRAGICNFIVKRYIKPADVAASLANEISSSICKRIRERDCIGISASVESCHVFIITNDQQFEQSQGAISNYGVTIVS